MLFWAVNFPGGCAGLVGIQLWYGGERIAPAGGSNDPWIRGNAESIYWQGEAQVDSIAPVRVLGYNDDQVYSHTILIRVDFGEKKK